MQPVWPIPAAAPAVIGHGGKAWGAPREGAGRPRRHAGVDVLAPEGAVVVAPVDATFVAHQSWSGPAAKAVLLEADGGPVFLLGAVAPNSWEEFGLGVGAQVSAGQPVARIGRYPRGSSMLHFELYQHGTRQNSRWYQGEPPPPNLLDPTPFLLEAAGGELPVVPDDDDDDGDDHDHGDELPVVPPGPDAADELDDDPIAPIEPPPVPPPGPSRDAAPLLLLLALAATDAL